MARHILCDQAARHLLQANASDSIGIKPGDRVATLAWNSYRHLELYYGISE
jgi:acyl-CoA synthetase (AMP-forming)/AMP-acid ligase II